MEKDHLEILLEDIRSKFDLVLEGHDVLRSEIRELGQKTGERFDLVEFKIDTLNRKIDNVAADLTAHRKDTEAHHGVYRVKEE
jgi:ribosomal protein S15P/S13E